MRFATPASRAALALLAIACLTLVACGGDDDSEPSPTTASETGTVADSGGACAEPDIVNVEAGGDHDDREFTADDYDTNPPSGGDHNNEALPTGQFYAEPPPLGQTVHALEHGAVIGWTNGLSKTDQRAVEDAFNEIYSPTGYFQLAVVENPDMDVPFALSAWGVVQTCDAVDTSVIRPFVEANYASDRTAEGNLACPTNPAKVPACAD